MTKSTILSVFVLGIIGLMTIAAVAQVNPGTVKHLTIATPRGLNVGLSANAIERRQPEGNVLELTGNVEIRSRDMILQADRATYDRNTGEIKPSGNVRLKLEPQE